MKRRLTSFVIVMVIAIFAAVNAYPLTQSEVEESLLCYACPGEPLTMDRCSGGDQMRSVIRRMIEEGKSKQEILDYFVARFGEGILTIPPKRGFNLVAYVFPFVGLVFGGVVVVVFLRKWKRGPKSKMENGEGNVPLDSEIDERLKKKIDDELDKLD